MNPGLHRAMREGEIVKQQRVKIDPKEHDEEGIGCSSGVVAVAGAIVFLTLATVVVVILSR